MWFIFPQYVGLGISATSQRYAIKSVAEAVAYLNDPVLGRRLIECSEAVLLIEGRSAQQIFGSPDDLKLKSCATLFAGISPAGSVFERVLDKYFGGERDLKTLNCLVCRVRRDDFYPRKASASSRRAFSQSRRTVRSVTSSAAAISCSSKPPK